MVAAGLGQRTQLVADQFEALGDLRRGGVVAGVEDVAQRQPDRRLGISCGRPSLLRQCSSVRQGGHEAALTGGIEDALIIDGTEDGQINTAHEPIIGHVDRVVDGHGDLRSFA